MIYPLTALPDELSMNEDFKVTPWEVSGETDYDLLVEKFGTRKIDADLIDRLSRYAEPHPLLKRGVVYSHRDMDWILDRYEAGEPFYLYTGRGPSGNTHLATSCHIFTKYLQDTFKVPLLPAHRRREVLNDNLEAHGHPRHGVLNLLDVIALG